MDTGNIIAALVWAIVCAGSIHGQTETSTKATTGQNAPILDTGMTNATITRPSSDLQPNASTPPNPQIPVAKTSSSPGNQSLVPELVPDTSTLKPNEPENCMVSRKADFIACFESLGNNAVQYIASKNLTGFLDDICDASRSKPYMECIMRHFRECPDFINRPEVQVLQFGPYHIKDIIYFSSIDQMCSCATGLVCIQELLKVKQQLTISVPGSPWLELPNFEAICDNETSRYIGCVRKNLRQCQSPLTKRYGDDFTNEDAEDIKRTYDFIKDHCDEIDEGDFLEKYKCIQEKSTSDDFRECINATESLPNSRKICEMRDCVKEEIEDECDFDDLIPVYIDAVNIYRHDGLRLLNNPCSESSAPEIGISVAAILVAFVIVVFV